MSELLVTICRFAFLGVVVLLCLFICYLANEASKYWEEFKREKKKNERR